MSDVEMADNDDLADDEVDPVIDEATAARHQAEALRIAEALVFASAEPVSSAFIEERLPRGIDARAVLHRLKEDYAGRGVNLVQVDDHWAFRTASDLSFAIRKDETEVKKLSRAALEVLAIIAYHQPVTRAEIEDIRGVQT
jgi:segregation and condensation protein B